MLRAFWVLLPLLAVAAFAGPVPPINATTGSDFTVDYNGFDTSAQTPIAGLTAQARFYNFGFAANGGNTLVTFSIDLTNNSSAPITGSRVSGMGFDTTPNIVNSGLNSVSGVFDTVSIGGNVPNGVGTVEFCFSDVNCAGGGGGGVTKGNTGTANASILLSGSVTSFVFDGLFVRYQSITGVPGLSSASGAAVPEPGFYGALALGLSGLMLALRRKRA